MTWDHMYEIWNHVLEMWLQLYFSLLVVFEALYVFLMIFTSNSLCFSSDYQNPDWILELSDPRLFWTRKFSPRLNKHGKCLTKGNNAPLVAYLMIKTASLSAGCFTSTALLEKLDRNASLLRSYRQMLPLQIKFTLCFTRKLHQNIGHIIGASLPVVWQTALVLFEFWKHFEGPVNLV